jgi:uncharacterized protein YndB with AHSA1/START domain
LTGDEEVRCRDAVVIEAPPAACFAPLVDLATYPRWWTLIAVTPLAGGPRLAPGVRFRFAGARPGGTTVAWVVEVLEVLPPERIELAYAEGDLLGRVAWELVPVAGGTEVAYVYRGVRANSAATRASFARFGTGLHHVAMREDALAGLRRLVTGRAAETDDGGWRTHVAERVAVGVRALG